MMDKETFIDDVEFLSKVGPVIIFCDDDRWKELLGDHALIDASQIGFSELLGTDYVHRSFFKPDWLLKAEETQKLVIVNLDKVPIRPETDNEMRQYDFSFLFRDEDREEAYRELNFGSGIFLPRGLKVIAVLKHNVVIDRWFLERCSMLKADEYDC